MLNFALLGSLLFAAKQLVPDQRDVIRISSADISQLRSEWTREVRRAPTGAELEAQIRQRADEETLFREALRLGLDRSDPVVRSRLVQNMRFIGAAQDETDLVEQALAVGMQRSDVLVRRRLVQAMQERFAAGIRPAESEVREYVAQNPQRYGGQPRASFRQRPVDGGRSASALLGEKFTNATEAQIARSFGEDFARAVMGAPQGQWSGPLRSSYGTHRVYVTGRTSSQAPDYVVVRKQAYYALLEERERQAAEAGLRALRRHYPVEVEHEALALSGAP